MPIKVLIIDDSLFIRSLVSDFLNKDPQIKVVGTASSGQEALRKIPNSRPDCIILDLAMPGWDGSPRGEAAGLTTLKHIMRDFPTPVVILSAYTKEDADITLECLELGAVSFVLKPSGELSLDIEKIKERLIQEIKAAAGISSLVVSRQLSVIRRRTKYGIRTTRYERRRTKDERRVIVIGASTGGPQTLELVLPSLPSDFSLPVLVAQHMPNRFFSESLSRHLNKNCSLKVNVASDDEAIFAPAVYLAPGGSHLRVFVGGIASAASLPLNDDIGTSLRAKRSNLKETEIKISLTEVSPDTLSPSIDMAMQSVARAYQENSIGIILSGIGNDGLKGMRSIKEAGGKTIAQDESALIFGMPKAVIDAGLADKVLPAEEIGRAILEEYADY